MMKIEKISYDFSVCKVTELSENDFQSEYCFIGKTEEENSLVCLTERVPENTLEREDGWKAFRIQGVLDFSLIGVLAGITALLAEKGIGVFVVSTYNTDYILVKEERYQEALETLAGAGYEVEGEVMLP